MPNEKATFTDEGRAGSHQETLSSTGAEPGQSTVKVGCFSVDQKAEMFEQISGLVSALQNVGALKHREVVNALGRG